MRVLELFCGIGGCAAALADKATSAVAIDINTNALEVYRRNFAHEIQIRELSSVSTAAIAAVHADLWWMSPPCQPFTAQGEQRDDRDPRTRPLLHLLQCFQELRPLYLAIENVPPFQRSQSHDWMIRILSELNYQWIEQVRCASEFGLPTRRRRYYLVASRDHDLSVRPPEIPCGGASAVAWRELAEELRRADAGQLAFDADRLLLPYAAHLHVVRASDTQAVTRCFTSAYGKSPLRSGSYLAVPSVDGGERLRHFSPGEILRCLGYPRSFQIPGQLTPRQAWSLVGNSLAVPVVRHVLCSIPSLSSLRTTNDCLSR